MNNWISYKGLLGMLLLLSPLEFPAKLKAGMPVLSSQFKPIYMNVSLIWTGTKADQQTIESLIKLKAMYPFVRWTHFFSLKFLTSVKKGNIAKLKQSLGQRDHFGVYVQPNEPYPRDFLPKSIFGSRDSNPEFTPLSHHHTADLYRNMKTTKTILEREFRTRCQRIMTHDWTTSASVVKAAAKAGMIYDMSPIPPELIENRLQGFPIFADIKNSWEHITPFTTPFYARSGARDLIQVPQSAGSIAYVGPSNLQQLFKAHAKSLTKSPNQARLFHLSVYAMNLGIQTNKLSKSLDFFQKYATIREVKIEPLPENITAAFTPNNRLTHQIKRIWRRTRNMW